MENAAGQLVGMEVKGAATVQAKDFASLRMLQESQSDRFQREIHFYTDDEKFRVGERLVAMPISAWWRLDCRAGEQTCDSGRR